MYTTRSRRLRRVVSSSLYYRVSGLRHRFTLSLTSHHRHKGVSLRCLGNIFPSNKMFYMLFHPFFSQDLLLQPNREWVHQGLLKAVYEKKELDMWLFLFSDILCYSNTNIFQRNASPVSRTGRAPAGRNTWGNSIIILSLSLSLSLSLFCVCSYLCYSSGPSTKKKLGRQNSAKENKQGEFMGKITLSELWIKDLPDSTGRLLPSPPPNPNKAK